MKFSMVLHAHQPPGNFDSVFQRAVDECYGPVLDLIADCPALRLSIHWSGSLLEWMEARTPERIAQIRRLVESRQVEIIAAGMYEPVLTLLPRGDRIGQLRTHRAYLQRLFGTDAHIGWLTERVWEPSLAADLVDGGIDAVTLDDRHLLSAGLLREDLGAPYLTESQGKSLLIAPVSEALRMAIPWRPVEEVLERLEGMVARDTPLAVYADDIEKFGMWPETYRDVIQDGWLARFFDGLVDLNTRAGLEVAPLGEVLATTQTAGRVYVPDGSYPEMLEWSLPPAGQRALARAREAATGAGLLDEVSPFMRAGQFLQYLAKYPEVNHLHKRMIDVSARAARSVDRLRSWDPDALPEAVRELWRAQANCVYWHGLFGGIYFPHLRHRLWQHVLRAECALEDAGERRRPLRVFDLDADREPEVMITTRDLVAVIDARGGSVVELSYRPAALNLGDTLARREEAYHDEAPYRFDLGRRGIFVDRILPAGDPPTSSDNVTDIGQFDAAMYSMKASRRASATVVSLAAEQEVAGSVIRIEKAVAIADGAPRVDATYRVTTGGRVDALFGVEVNLGILFAEHPRGELVVGDRTFSLPAGGAVESVTSFTIAMDEMDARITIEVDHAADLDVRPIETVSRSEGGTERTAQQLAVLLSWPLRLSGVEMLRRRVSLTLQPTGVEA